MTERNGLAEPGDAELCLSSRLVEAQARYQRMALKFRQAAEERERALLSSPENDQASRQALEDELAALRYYQRVMTAFTTVMIEGPVQTEE